MANQLVSGAYGFEVIVKPGQQTIYFNDIAILRNKRIKHIDLVDNISLGRSGLDIGNIYGSITLRTAQSQINIIDKMNLREISTSQRLGNRIAFNHYFDFSKSFVQVLGNASLVPVALYFVVWYDEPSIRRSTAKPVSEIQFFEIQLKQSRTLFREENKLRNKRYRNLIASFPVITPSGLEGISEESSKKMFVTLQKGSLQFFQNVPLYLFYQYELYEQLRLENITFDFTNSFIDIVNPEVEDFKSVFFNAMIE